MEPDTERSIAPNPPPPIDQESRTPSSLSSQTIGGNDKETPSRHSGVPSTINEDECQDKEERDVELAQKVSIADSLQPPPVKIPRANRRGLLARFTVIAEVEEPKNYSRGTKWFITFIIALAAVAAPLGSAIILRRHDVSRITR